MKDIVSTYNSKTNITLKLSPNEAYIEINYTKAMKNLEKHYSKAFKNRKKPRYKVRDRVRISKIPKEGPFRKGYKTVFSEEVFTVVKSIVNFHNLGIFYKIQKKKQLLEVFKNMNLVL